MIIVGTGEAVATGGRYDGLVGQFGKDTPAIGLAIVLDQLMLALTRQNILDEKLVSGCILLYPKELREEALNKAAALRKSGENVQLVRKSSQKDIDLYKDYAKRMNKEKLLYLKDKTVVEEITFK